MPRPTLPHRARGIEGENFAVQFIADKIVFVPRFAAAGEHYTFHAGPDSGVLDRHETRMPSGRSEEHRTLFAMRRDDLPAALRAGTPLLSELLALLRPLRLGWLKHHGIGIACGVDLISDEDIAAATRKRKGRLAIDPQLYERNIFVPEFLEEVYDFPDGNFALLRRRRRIGIGFKMTVAGGDVRLSWIKHRPHALRPQLGAESDECPHELRHSTGTLRGLYPASALTRARALPIFSSWFRLE